MHQPIEYDDYLSPMEAWLERVRDSEPTTIRKKRKRMATKAQAYLAVMLGVYDQNVQYPKTDSDHGKLASIYEEEEVLERPSSCLSMVSVCYSSDWDTDTEDEREAMQPATCVDVIDLTPLSPPSKPQDLMNLTGIIRIRVRSLEEDTAQNLEYLDDETVKPADVAGDLIIEDFVDEEEEYKHIPTSTSSQKPVQEKSQISTEQMGSLSPFQMAFKNRVRPNCDRKTDEIIGKSTEKDRRTPSILKRIFLRFFRKN